MKNQEKLFKIIDRKFENMTEDELDEYDWKVRRSLSKQSGKQFEARKKNGYKNYFKKKRKRFDDEDDY